MTVLFEFLGSEPIENLITCMNFEIDKVIYFGYQEVIETWKGPTENYLQKYCGVEKTVFHPLSHDDLKSVIKMMRTEIDRERGLKNQVFFDVTGGEDLILVAFGILSREFETPMHMFNIREGKLIILDDGASCRIDEVLQPRKIPFGLDNLLEMRGGKINRRMHKEQKQITDAGYKRDITAIKAVIDAHSDLWSAFSMFMGAHMIPGDDLMVSVQSSDVTKALSGSDGKLTKPRQLNRILDELAGAGVLTDLVHQNGRYRFRYKSEYVKDLLCDCGSVLELCVYLDELETSDECMVGVHIDWDGEIHTTPGIDVLNEIDVLSLKGYIPTFISCKSGNMKPVNTRNALYELDSVARKCGGKYARKVLATEKEISDVNAERAREMGIEVRVNGK